MRVVEVHNLNEYPYTEQFRDQLISIPAKGFIEMEYEEAINFKGRQNPVKFNGDGKPLKSSYKMIKIVQNKAEKEAMAEERRKATTFKCQACGYDAEDKQALHIHVKEEHAHQLADPKVAKQLIKKK